MTLNSSGQLYIVATPIGNLADITFRAVKTLQNVDFIICEDTRHSLKLLQEYDIKQKLISFHSHSKEQKVKNIIKKILQGKNAALISDAGTPGISDPGFLLTTAAVKNNIKIIPIPGPTAFLTALQASGAPINKFVYLGFLPIKKGRKTILESFPNEKNTIVFYESVHRIKKTLSELQILLGEDRKIVIARELTKKYEEFFRGTIAEALQKFVKPKGEFVFILPAQK